MNGLEVLLRCAARATHIAAAACRKWEDGGDSDAVAETAWEADDAISEALSAVGGMDPALRPATYPETRLGRLVMAARLLVLAGTDEGGQSQDLELAVTVLRAAEHA